MYKKINVVICLVVLSFLVLAGCVDILKFDDGSVLYTSHPTKIKYSIRYGYHVNISGTGNYNIYYDCDTPEVITGTKTYEILYPSEYTIEDIVGNPMIRWNITGTNNKDYKIGVKAEIETESYMISDLNGDAALTIDQIKNNHPTIFNQYTKPQVANNIVYVDTENPNIKNIAEQILQESESNNSFIIAKNLFVWLKTNTSYLSHLTDSSVQPAIQTYTLRTGDCDDLSVLYISLCRAAEIPARFIRGMLIEKNDDKIEAIPHAWVEVYVGSFLGNDGWIPVECAGTTKGKNKIQAEINQNFAIESVNHLRLFKGEGSNESFNISISGPKVYYDSNTVVSMISFAEVENYEIIESKGLHVANNYRCYK
jgi:transglutaminase-like putative cysteine protease